MEASKTLLLFVNLSAAVAVIRCEKAIDSGKFLYAGTNVHYRMLEGVTSGSPVILFLHGVKYTSNDWIHSGILRAVNDWGYTTLAIDLPGFGQSPRLIHPDSTQYAGVVKAAFDFGLRGSSSPKILISPSMSGKWAGAFIDQYGDGLTSWVAIAPAGVSQWKGPPLNVKNTVKLLAVYGEQDRMKEESHALLSRFTQSKLVVIPSAGHACYLEQTQPFLNALSLHLSSVAPLRTAAAI